MDLIQSYLADEAGTSAIEYGLVASLMSVVILAAAATLGLALVATFDQVVQTFLDATD